MDGALDKPPRADYVPSQVSNPAPFPAETAWSAILRARDRANPERRKHLERLIAIYWPPVYWYLIRRWNLKQEDAADLTQELFVRLVEEEFLDEVVRERGRFRTFLKLKLRDLVVEDLRKRSAQKRGGLAHVIKIDASGKEPAWQGIQPDEAFDRDWALCLMNEAVGRLEREMKGQGKETALQVFRRCVLDQPPLSYQECARQFSLKEGDVRNYVFRTRAQLREVVRAMVCESVDSEAEAHGEFAFLTQLLDT
ncbi:MAG: sigma-70 family RNA polymerase sigma factor [Planctomycetes bacterium]|nr:sigma-70 family RNA polymerase sigma factor [Planctomycetota bacterium]